MDVYSSYNSCVSKAISYFYCQKIACQKRLSKMLKTEKASTFLGKKSLCSLEAVFACFGEDLMRMSGNGSNFANCDTAMVQII